jgi:hypothetical protein
VYEKHPLNLKRKKETLKRKIKRKFKGNSFSKETCHCCQQDINNFAISKTYY